MMKQFLSIIFLLALISPLHAQLAVPNDAGLAFGHVHLNVSDVELHKKLWVEYFDGVVLQKGQLTMVKFPGFLLALREQEPTDGSQGSVMNHFGFKVRNLAKFLSNWRAAGYSVDREFNGTEGQPNAYVTMADGVWVELQEDQMLPVEVSGYHIHFLTAEFEELLDWYVDVFDLEIRPRGRIQTTTNVPGMNMSFATSDVPTVGTSGRAIDHIGFEVDDLEAFCQNLAAKGIAFDVEYREVEALELKLAFITDPSGVSIELTEGLDRY
jgi:catechol 2,3-dioxygenase-like lactoylglutathione lyase family enzyme